MKLRKLSVLVAGGFLSVTLGATAFAYDRKYGDGQTNWYEHGDSSAGPLKNTIKGNHLGTAATLQNASRQIVLGNNTKYVNVKSGETVKFAQQQAYKIVDEIKFDGAQYRTDIGYRAVKG